MRIRQALCLLMLSVLSSAVAAQVNTIYVNPRQALFQVTLPANPTTGYQWQVQQYNHALLKMVSQHYYSQKNNSTKPRLVGVGGQTVFQFKLKNPQFRPKSTDISFKYSRPWESSAVGKMAKVNVIFD